MAERGDVGKGDARITVAVLDGPVDRSHPSLAGALLEFPRGQPDFDAKDAAARHGTQVASIVFGQPGTAVAGIAPRCRGLVIPIFTRRGDGGLACSQLDLARAILLAVENGAHFINVSGGQLWPSAEPEPVLAQAIESCAAHGVLIVAAAGNDGCDCLHVPAAVPSVLAVGAMDAAGRPLATSNFGAAYALHGLLAPGDGVTVAAPGGGVEAKRGTSYATPFVTGHAALLACRQLDLGRPVDTRAIRAALLAGAKPCPDPGADPGADQGDGECRRFLTGRIDVNAARELIEGGLVMTEDFSAGPAGAELFAATPAEDWTPPSAAPAWRPTALPGMGDGVIASGETQIDLHAGVVASGCGCGCKGGEKAPGVDCGCGCGGAKAGGEAPKKTQYVYALGRLGYDFGSEARRDSLAQAMSGAGNPLLPDQWLAYLDANPFDASSVIWTLNLDATPIYAIQPFGPFAAVGFERLREALRAQLVEGVELISVPGVIAGETRLQSGQVVPVIVPAIRGMYSWATKPLVAHVLGAVPKAAGEREVYNRFSAGLTNFLDRVYYDLRNLGITGEERALNYSATNAVQIADVIRSTTQDALDLDRLAVKRSPVCRPDSECYDVELSFFNPANTNIANRVYRFTVDVSDIIPVTVGAVRSWTRRA